MNYENVFILTHRMKYLSQSWDSSLRADLNVESHFRNGKEDDRVDSLFTLIPMNFERVTILVVCRLWNPSLTSQFSTFLSSLLCKQPTILNNLVDQDPASLWCCFSVIFSFPVSGILIRSLLHLRSQQTYG